MYLNHKEKILNCRFFLHLFCTLKTIVLSTKCGTTPICIKSGKHLCLSFAKYKDENLHLHGILKYVSAPTSKAAFMKTKSSEISIYE